MRINVTSAKHYDPPIEMYNTIEPRLIALLNDSSLEKRKSPSLNLPPLQRARVSRRPSPLEPETNTNSSSQPTSRPSISRQISSTEAQTEQDNGGTTAASLGVSSQLSGKTSSQSLRKILGDDDYQGDARTTKKRRKLDSGNDEFVQLPQPAPKKQKTTPQIVPPIIIGLFEPPPNAALFPPIASSSFHDSLGRNSLNTTPLTGPGVVGLQAVTPSNGDTKGSQAEKKPKVQPRRKWTEEETRHLLLGVHKHGLGKWKSILNDPEFHFDHRNAVDLKDRFRTCCPNEIRSRLTGTSSHSTRKKLDTRDGNTANAASAASDASWPSSAADGNDGSFASQEGYVDDTSSKVTVEDQPVQVKRARKSRAHRKQIADLKELGINVPFRPSARRERRPFTEEEDNQILQGWERHGQAWTRILSDPELKLQGRRSTDLRDRFRNRFPEKYADAVPKNFATTSMSESTPKEVASVQVDSKSSSFKADYIPVDETSIRQNLLQHQSDRYTLVASGSNIQGGNLAGKSVPQYGMHAFKDAPSEASFNMEMPLLWNDHLNSIGEMDIQRFLLDESWPMPGLPIKHKPSFTDIESICAPVSGTPNGVSAGFSYDALEFRDA